MLNIEHYTQLNRPPITPSRQIEGDPLTIFHLTNLARFQGMEDSERSFVSRNRGELAHAYDDLVVLEENIVARSLVRMRGERSTFKCTEVTDQVMVMIQEFHVKIPLDTLRRTVALFRWEQRMLSVLTEVSGADSASDQLETMLTNRIARSPVKFWKKIDRDAQKANLIWTANLQSVPPSS